MRNRGLLALVTLLLASCSGSAESAAHHNYSLVGSTACDAAIKTALTIPPETKCDFIRWNLSMDPAKDNAFALDVNYGESQPNTLGFISGGQRIAAAGKFESQTLADKREIFKLRSAKPAIDLALVKLNANVFHLLMPDGTMIVGNGGWSYSLHRSSPLATSVLSKATFGDKRAREAKVTFDGRTPCGDFPRLFKITRDPSCLKIKWRVILNRDPSTLEPSTFSIAGIIPDRTNTITGRWSESKLATGATVLKLEPEGTPASVSFLLAEDNLLFFLDSAGRPMTGNKDFSFTLNRKADL